jgi:carboxyl-terminal processing protease
MGRSKSLRIWRLVVGGLCAAGLIGCDHAPPAAPGSEAAPLAIAPAAAAAPAGSEGGAHASEPFTGGAQVFRSVMDTLRSKYYRENISEDELYRAAVAGMLQHLEPQMAAWNKLLPPAEMRELTADLRGEIVGIGVEIKFDPDSGISDVLGIVPGSPAERAGLREGDKLLTVGGKFYRGKTLRDVVADIRGQAGETVRLTVLRGAEVLPFAVRRERVVYDVVATVMLPGEVGYLRIGQFTDGTPGLVSAALQELSGKRAKALVLDLRANQGGLFDKAVATAELFLPKGTPIVKVRRRSEQAQTLYANPKAPPPSIPIVLLVDGGTASGGELVAAALHEGAGAQLFGQKTFGKGSVQEVEDLPNHYGIKYTASLFLLPSGAPLEGVGLTPDVEVMLPVPEGGSYERQLSRVQRLPSIEQRLSADVPLRAAVNVVRLRIK